MRRGAPEPEGVSVRRAAVRAQLRGTAPAWPRGQAHELEHAIGMKGLKVADDSTRRCRSQNFKTRLGSAA